MIEVGTATGLLGVAAVIPPAALPDSFARKAWGQEVRCL